ncbi:CerR family C-terminal domain-containing protein [Aestuariispira insulae]|uniref:TetR family transcriptional regulator n=1 Tax=Aestuariispira insulae TaxID=1461337 RepID=A0A3D9HWB8_9PROT|nr:CerR family C-terminal domain-containing protein [Aestuariispira insulae]RED53681.1 TetR family transcriptional regulator [Aestuariispira insulae]
MIATDLENTRSLLLKSAAGLFAEKGYEGVSIRTLARAVDANIAAIGYHFGGKEELYRETCRFVVANMKPRMAPVRESLQAILDKPGFDPVTQSADVRAFVALFISRFVHDDLNRSGQALLLREYANPGIGFEIFYAEFIEPMHRMITRLYARIRGMDENDPASIIGAHSLLGQWLAFKLAEEPFLRRMGWERVEEGQVAGIQEVVVPTVMRSLGLDRD